VTRDHPDRLGQKSHVSLARAPRTQLLVVFAHYSSRVDRFNGSPHMPAHRIAIVQARATGAARGQVGLSGLRRRTRTMQIEGEAIQCPGINAYPTLAPPPPPSKGPLTTSSASGQQYQSTKADAKGRDGHVQGMQSTVHSDALTLFIHFGGSSCPTPSLLLMLQVCGRYDEGTMGQWDNGLCVRGMDWLLYMLHGIFWCVVHGYYISLAYGHTLLSTILHHSQHTA
jgi:hypothetical protein